MQKTKKRFLLIPLVGAASIGFIAANAIEPPVEHYSYSVTTERLETMSVTVDGEVLELTGKTNENIANVLERNNIDVSLRDRVTPHRYTMIGNDTSDITIQRVTTQVEDKSVSLPFKNITQEEKIECQTPQVITRGVKGEKIESWEKTFVDGVEESFEKIREKVKVEPVNEVTAECLPPRETPVAKKTQETSEEKVVNKTEKGAPKKVAKSAPGVKNISGGKQEWMRAAGIPESEWGYVDYIVSRESGWNPNAVNPSSGACGLAQSLPCGKSEAYGAWNDPVAQLKWQRDYVQSRYGGYAGAYQHSQSKGWY